MSVNKDLKSTATIAENGALANDKRGFPFKKIFFALLIVLIVLSIFLLIINIIINSYFSKVKVFDGKWAIDMQKLNSMPMYQDNVGYFSQTEELHAAYHAALLNHAQATSDMKYDENVYNYAVFGIDQFENSTAPASADIVMVISINKNNKQVTYFSFETKLLTYIPAVGVGPMSDAYLLGGPQLLTNTLEQNYGIQIDGFVELNMSAFSLLIDKFGAYEIHGNKELLERINKNIESFNESKGLQGADAVGPANMEGNKIFLNGQQTLAYMSNGGAEKSNIANSVLSQLTTKIYSGGFGAIKTTLDISLERMMISMKREDIGALLQLGFAVLNNIETTPVGNTGRVAVQSGIANVPSVGYTCNYQAERTVLINNIYG